MTDTQAEATQKSVRTYRHEAVNTLRSVRQVLTKGGVVTRNEQTKAVADATNGAISSILRGEQGLSQDEQVAHLDDANAKVAQARTVVSENSFGDSAVASALTALFNAAIDQAEATLTEASEYAASRDFDAWQAAKKAAKPSFDSTYAEEEESDDEGDTEE